MSKKEFSCKFSGKSRIQIETGQKIPFHVFSAFCILKQAWLQSKIQNEPKILLARRRPLKLTTEIHDKAED